MAPEQADLQAVPDARWDVYALGALLYCMLTGEVPHRNDTAVQQIDTAADLDDRLARYRAAIRTGPAGASIAGCRASTGALADIIDRCLAADPAERFSNVQSVLEALDARDDARKRQPLQILGIVLPIALFLIMAFFGYRAYRSALFESTAVVKQRAQESNSFAAKLAAERVAGRSTVTFARSSRWPPTTSFRSCLSIWPTMRKLRTLLEELDAPGSDAAEHDPARATFVEHSGRQPLQQFVGEAARST